MPTHYDNLIIAGQEFTHLALSLAQGNIKIMRKTQRPSTHRAPK